jgi:hypothetical protein
VRAAPAGLAHVKGPGDRRGHESVIAHGAEIDDPDVADKRIDQFERHGQGNACLTDSARTDEGDHAPCVIRWHE